MALEEIRNWLVIDERIATAGQPSLAQLRQVAQAGYQVVINLGLLDPKYCLPDEAQLVESTGMSYRHIPVQFDAPKEADFAAFATVMDDLAAGPMAKRVFVHCAANHRVSTFMALWGQMRLGWTRERADEHARRLWAPDPVWAEFLERCRARFCVPGGAG